MFHVCCVYKLLHFSFSTWEPSLINLLDNLTADSKPLILVGDFSENLLRGDSFTNRLQTDFHLSQLINELTCVTKSSAMLINHIYSSYKSIISLSAPTFIYLTIILHSANYLVIDLLMQRNLLFSSVSDVLIKMSIKDFFALLWSILYSRDNIDDAVNIFEKLFSELYDTHVRLKERLVCTTWHKHWLNGDLLASYLQHDMYCKQFQQGSLSAIWMANRLARNQCTAAIQTVKHTFFLAASDELRLIWSKVSRSVQV